MVVGIIDLQMGTRDIRRLGGLMSLMPFSFTVAMLGSFSMAGLPLFNGFLSKEMFFTSVLNIAQLNIFSLDTWGTLFPVVAWTASVFTFVYCLIIVFKTFFGEYKGRHLEGNPSEHKQVEPPMGMLVSPLILGVFIVGIFFFPNVIGKYIIFPAMGSIFPTFNLQAADFPISAWHGFNTELWMTIGIIVLGTLLYLTLRYWRRIYRLFPDTRSLDALYNHTLGGMERGAARVTKGYMTGFLRDYLVYIYLFFIALVGGAMLYTGSFSVDFSNDSQVTAYEWIFMIIIITAAVAVLFAKSRLTAILLNSVIGFSVVFFFVLFRAPDLALTQTIIETVTTVLFLLSFYFLPDWKKEKTPVKSKVTNVLISIAVGTIFIVVGLSVNSGQLSESISKFFENAYELAGGNNIVNAILGDFRAFDTMLEVVVLFIGGIGVYAFLKLKDGKERKNIEDQ